MNGINIKYIYSACIVSTTNDATILHDPWFTEGVYDGSWYQFPKVEDPIELIGDVDYIYVSHIHPDHYDPSFIKKYFSVYGVKPILIADHQPNFLINKMRGDGLTAEVLSKPLIIGDTSIQILPHKTGSVSDIDSAIIIKILNKDKQHCVVNANDIIFDEDTRRALKEMAGDIDILLCGYTGAGPYPQTYIDINSSEIKVAAENKKKAFFNRYLTLVQFMDAKVNIPFAGKYILGGNLTHLNEYRGVADPVEVLELDERAIVLKDAGGEINTSKLIPNETRVNKYDQRDIDLVLENISKNKMEYEKLMNKDAISQLPLYRILSKAAYLASQKSECDQDYFFSFEIYKGEFAVINCNKSKSGGFQVMKKEDLVMEPRTDITIDNRYLFGLLTNIYHWNNAEVGSQFISRRYPDELNRHAQRFLNFLSL